MSSMTCRSGFILAAAICLGSVVVSTRGGSLNPPAGPTDPNSAMFTLNDIYTVLDTRIPTNATRRTGAFTEPAGGPTNGTMHTLNEIMALVANRAPVPKTGQSAQTTYDDGWYSTNAGMAWPNPRYTTNGVAAASNCVTDNLTGLMWLKNPDATTRTWSNAITYCETMDGADGRGGYTDWRMPNWQELRSQLDAGNVFPALSSGNPSRIYIINSWYWSSTTYPLNIGQACYMQFFFGRAGVSDKTTLYHVWPVRGGQ